MKKQIIILGSLLLIATITKAQNVFPTPSGNVGIGTTSPARALEISTGAIGGGIKINRTGSEGHLALELNNATPSGRNWSFLSLGYNDGPGAGNFIIADNVANRLFIKGGTGEVGIGTTVPGAKLDILSTSNQLRLSYSNSIYSDLQTTSSGNFCISSWGGKVGIGTTAPNAGIDLRTTAGWPLSISGGAGSAAYEYRVQQSTGNVGSWVLNSAKSYGFGEDNSGIGHIWSDVNNSYKILNFKSIYGSNAPQVWIGNSTPQSPHTDFMFAVAGKVVAQSLYITASGSPNWADYVFASDYKVPNLYDIEKYYQANKHLPEIPSAAEVKENGINVGEMNTLLLKKIEEMTILMVKQQREIDELKTKIK
jgi:hypothetical protein